MKRDLKINFGVLDSLLGELYEFRQAVENMQDGVRKLDALLAEAEGETFETIRARKTEIEDHLQRYYEQTDDVFRLVEDYTAEMTQYIKPFHRHEMMRVDRDDIWFNLLSMQAALAPLRLVQDMLLSTHPRYEPDEAIREQIEHARRHNKAQVEDIEWRVRNLESKLSNQVEIMKHAYGVRIVPFENTDDKYKHRAQEVYDKYTSLGERMSNVGTAIDKAVDDFGNGLWQSVVDTVVGLVKLPYGLVQYVADGAVVLFCKMIGSPVPSWAGQHFNGTNDMISSVVSDPFILIEGLAQGISDTYEDEGIVYMSGYIAGEALQIYMAKRFSDKGTGNISGSMSPEDAAKFNEWQRLKAEGFTAEDLYNYEKFGSIKTQLEYTTTSGLKLVGVDGKTTTILGTYVDDTREIVDELGNIKSVDFGPKNGGFNVLNTPDELYVTPEQFWSEYNKPWLDNAISRRDVIKIATIPSDSTLYRINNITGLKELTGFGREYMYLIEHGYTFDWLTMSMMRK